MFWEINWLNGTHNVVTEKRLKLINERFAITHSASLCQALATGKRRLRILFLVERNHISTVTFPEAVALRNWLGSCGGTSPGHFVTERSLKLWAQDPVTLGGFLGYHCCVEGAPQQAGLRALHTACQHV